MGKRILALRLRSSLIFSASPPPIFHSSLKSDHLIVRNKTNRQAHTDKNHEAQITGIPYPAFPPEKESNTIAAAFQGGSFSPFPPGSNCLFSLLPFSVLSGLRLAFRKMVFGATGGVVLLLSGRVPTEISAGKKVFPPKFEPTSTCKQPSAVVRPVSPFGGHCCPDVSSRTSRWWFELRRLRVHPTLVFFFHTLVLFLHTNTYI